MSENPPGKGFCRFFMEFTNFPYQNTVFAENALKKSVFCSEYFPRKKRSAGISKKPQFSHRNLRLGTETRGENGKREGFG